MNLFAGIANGGVYLSTDEGANWVTVNNGLTNTNIAALAVIDTIIFAGTNGGGVFFSSDNGTNWFQTNTGLGSSLIRTLVIDSENIYAGTSNGVYFSSNYGANWIDAGLADTNVISCLSMA